jgi:uncharacterized coiled-coil protein SlyX
VPAHHLTEDRWRAIRAEWVTGTFSTRALAAKAGVSEKAIRLRASNPRQEGGPWQRDGRTPGRQGRRMVTVRTLRGSAEGRALLQAPIDARAEAEERRRIAASPEVRAALREIAIDNAAEALARHNLEHLRRLKLFRALINRFGQLLWDAVAPIPEGDEAAATRAAKARRLLLAGRGDGIARNLVAYARLLESLQRQTHKALGLEDRVRRLEPPGPPPVPPRTAALPALDLSQLSDAEMEALKTVAALLEDTRGEQPAPASR